MKKWIPALGTIKQELAKCRKANRNVKIGDDMQWIHHGQPIEKLNEPIEHRINYILSNKPKYEQAARFRAMRPVTLKQVIEYKRMQPERDAVNAKWRSERDAVNAKRRSELDAVYAKWQSELDAVNAKRRSELDAVYAKWQPELDAVYAKRQPELDAVYAKRQPELDAVDAKPRSELDAVWKKYARKFCKGIAATSDGLIFSEDK